MQNGIVLTRGENERKGRPFLRRNHISEIFQQLYHQVILFVNLCKLTNFNYIFVYINELACNTDFVVQSCKNTLTIRVFLPCGTGQFGR